MGRLEEFLCGNASDIQAGAAQGAVFDQPDVESDPCAVQGRGVAAGPPPITMTSWCASVALTSSLEVRSYRPSRDDLIELKG